MRSTSSNQPDLARPVDQTSITCTCTWSLQHRPQSSSWSSSHLTCRLAGPPFCHFKPPIVRKIAIRSSCFIIFCCTKFLLAIYDLLSTRPWCSLLPSINTRPERGIVPERPTRKFQGASVVFDLNSRSVAPSPLFFCLRREIWPSILSLSYLVITTTARACQTTRPTAQRVVVSIPIR